jgi:oligopeptide transport system substrate-binding protein
MILGTATVSTAALTLAACGGGDDSGDGGTGGDGGGSGEAVYANTGEPENPLVPTNTNEVQGGRVIDLVNARLISFKEDGSVENELAESVESEDNITWTIKLKADQKFSDGTPITAQSFVDAWNFGANANNAQLAASFFEPIEGYADVSAEDAKEDDTMSGLTVEDDTTFTVKLVSEQSDFGLRVGYSAFAPLPESAFEDIEAYGEKPASSGPYLLDAWDHDQQLVLVPNPDYTGPRQAKNGGITFLVYEDTDTMYGDYQSGNVDVVDIIPDSALETFQDELGDLAINQPGALFQSFTFAAKMKGFSGEAGKLRRQAISRAIDRKSICDALYFGTRTPATDWVAPTLPGGGSTDIAGAEVLEYDADEAKKLWDEAEAMEPFDGEFALGYNADSPHKAWVEAVCNSIKNTLGIEASPAPVPTFGEFRKQINERSIETAFRSGWQADYPSLYNFLAPLYSSAAADGNGSNDGDYKNEEVDKLLAEGLAAADEESAIEIWKKAESILFEDLPAGPLWYQNAFGAYGDAVSDVAFGWNTVPLYYQIAK